MCRLFAQSAKKTRFRGCLILHFAVTALDMAFAGLDFNFVANRYFNKQILRDNNFDGALLRALAADFGIAAALYVDSAYICLRSKFDRQLYICVNITFSHAAVFAPAGLFGFFGSVIHNIVFVFHSFTFPK